MKIGDEAVFNPEGRWQEFPAWMPRIGERVQVLKVYPRYAPQTTKVNGELVDIVSIDTGALYERVSVEWFEGKEEPF